MLTLTMTKGLPGSGKSTWALEQMRANPGSTKRVNKDELRAMLHCGHFTRSNEGFVLRLRDHIIREALLDGKHVIVDDTNLHPKHEAALKAIVEEMRKERGACGFAVKSFLDVPLETCITQDLKRLNSVGESVIRRMHREFVQVPDPPPGSVAFIPGLPDAVIVDIDGTLASMNGRSPYEWARVGEDMPQEDIIALVQQLAEQHEILLVSGRDAVCRPQTMAWLEAHKIPYHALLMRPEGNMEKDSVIKERIYREHIEGHYNVRFVLDDRDQVVQLWRSLGLRCLQVAYGDF